MPTNSAIPPALHSALRVACTCTSAFVSPAFPTPSQHHISSRQVLRTFPVPSLTKRRLPVSRLRRAVLQPPLCTAAQPVRKKGKHDLDDPFHLDTALSDEPTAFSAQQARTSLQALVTYYRELCRQQPLMARRLVAAVFCILASKIIGITVPLILKRIIDLLMQSAAMPIGATARPTFRLIASVVLLYAVATVLASVAHELRNTIFGKAGQRIGRSITASSFAHIHSLESAFHTSSRTGAITRVVDRGTRSVMTIFRGLLFNFMPSIFELLLVCAVLVRSFSGLYVAITLSSFFGFIVYTLAINDELGKVRAEMNSTENEASAKLTDSLMNVEAVKSFDNAKFELARYDVSLAEYERIALRNERLYAMLNIGQGAIFTAGLTLNLLLATKGVLTGALTVGSVVLLSTMLQQLWIPLNFLGWQYREVKQSLIDLQNLFDVLKREPKIADARDAANLEVSGGEIVFDNVSFTYPQAEDSMLFASKQAPAPVSLGNEDSKVQFPERKLALDGVSFTVPPGKSLALVGASGSGKSTATRLIIRLYDLTSGKITIDGQDISKATVSSLRQAVSIVPQDTVLFNDTVAYNIRYGRPTATDEEVIAAAKAASIHDVIMRTAQGYQTLVGERGIRLSGGERQRLSVARAFLKGSKIIIEDESTSALGLWNLTPISSWIHARTRPTETDTMTEIEVSQALQKLGVNRTRIIVAHRLSTIMNVDHIAVLRLGKKVEEGSFSELLSIPNGVFKGMWERQQKNDDDDDDIVGRDDSPRLRVSDVEVNGSNVASEVEGIRYDPGH